MAMGLLIKESSELGGVDQVAIVRLDLVSMRVLHDREGLPPGSLHTMQMPYGEFTYRG